MSFSNLGLSDKVLAAVAATGYTTPTPIQETTPIAHDCLTGSTGCKPPASNRVWFTVIKIMAYIDVSHSLEQHFPFSTPSFP